MNTIYYANPKTGKRATVKVATKGGMSYMDQDGQRDHKGNLPLNHSRRRKTMAEADKEMLAKGFVRWPRSKPLPGQQQRKAA